MTAPSGRTICPCGWILSYETAVMSHPTCKVMENPTIDPEQQIALDVDLSDPGSLPDEAIEQAVTLMKSGRLHRYGEYSETEPHAALFEKEFAEYIGSRYAIGVNSGGCALFLGLKIAGVEPGDTVLVNAFNLAPVPGAIKHAGAGKRYWSKSTMIIGSTWMIWNARRDRAMPVFYC